MTNRHTAFNILKNIIDGGTYANLALKKGLVGMPHGQAAEVTAIVYNTIERINYADFLLDHYANGRLHGSVRLVLRMGIVELLYMDTPAYAVCNESVKLAKDIGKGALSGFVNAVLRRIERERTALPPLPQDPVKRFNILYGVPEFMAQEYISRYGESFTEAFLGAKVHSLTVRAQYPYTAAELETYLNKCDIPYRRGALVSDAFILDRGFDAGNNELFNSGRITIQSESAMLVCQACGARDGDTVIDACAAPGGKSAYLASIMHNDGRIVAWDVHRHRVELMKCTFDRLHVSTVSAAVNDASEPKPELAGSAEIVLVDAPCSGLGGGSKPDAYLNRTEQGVSELARLQGKILDSCCNYVRPGGTLVYATCTVSKRENEENVTKFLTKHDEFMPDKLDFCLPDGYAERASGGMIQLFPNLDGTDGFFIARMKRRA